MSHQRAATIIRWFFILLLGSAGIAKLLDLVGFFAVVASFAVLPEAIIPAAALALALLELALAGWLVFGTTHTSRKMAAACVVALHVIYFIWLAIAYARGLHIPNCGCFGVYWPRPLTAMSFVEDGVLIGLALYLYVRVGRNNTPAPHKIDA
jgi:Methylamine utilisation protein MauE